MLVDIVFVNGHLTNYFAAKAASNEVTHDLPPGKYVYSFSYWTHVNFITETDDDERIRAACGEDVYDRLAALKAERDPENVFHLNQTIHRQNKRIIINNFIEY